MLISKKNQLIGLDIGSYSIKLVEIEHKKNKKILKNIGIAHIPPNSLSPTGSIRDPDSIKKAITALFENLKIKNKKVAVALPCASVIAKKISLMEQVDLDLEEAIKHEAEQFVPFDIEEVNIDYDIMDTVYEEGKEMGRMEIMVVVAKKELIKSYVDLLEEIDLSPEVMDVDIFALHNSFELNCSEINPEKIYFLIDIGAQTINTDVVKGNMSLFVRSSAMGGIQITKRVMQEFRIGFKDAEKIKLGIIELEEEQNKKIRSIFREVIEEWIDEIKGNLQFIDRTYPGEEVEKIFITGGCANIIGLEELLANELGVPVEKLDSFAGLTINKKIDPDYLKYINSQSAVAVGLALRSIGDK